MPAYNFQPQFVQPVLEKTKIHTIRRRRKNPTEAGDWIAMYTGLRTKAAHMFAESIVIEVKPIVLWPVVKKLSWSFTGPALSRERTLEIARHDGFNTIADFFTFFERYPFIYLDDFEIIEWDVDRLTRC